MEIVLTGLKWGIALGASFVGLVGAIVLGIFALVMLLRVFTELLD